MKQKNIYLFAVLFNFIFFAGACSSPQSKTLKEIHVGMDKADVLELAGNPTRIHRHLGQDRWTYEDLSYKSSEPNTSTATKPQKTYVYFSDGRVTYVGPAEINPDAPPAAGATSNSKNKDAGFKTISE